MTVIPILELLDRLAISWINRRNEYAINHNPDLKEWQLDIQQLHLQENGLEIMAICPGLVTLAEEAAKLLETKNAANYFSFEMLPRLDRQLRPVEVTVKWADKLSPAKKAGLLAEALREYCPDHPLLKGLHT